MADGVSQGRKIEVQRGIVGGASERPTGVRVRPLNDFRHLGDAYLALLAKYSSPLLMGPPVCDQLAAFLQHVFTEDEAAVVRHLSVARGHTAEQIARVERQPVEKVEKRLRRLAEEKRVIAASGRAPAVAYYLLPIVPGMFEMCLVTYSVDTLTPWHQEFIERFEALYETGYMEDYGGRRSAAGVRFLPVGRAIEAHPMALPTDRLEMVLDRFDDFAVGKCQCRTSMAALGRGCDGPIGNCAIMGRWARQSIAAGAARRVSREEMLDIKREAEAHGMVNWLMNVEGTKSQISCSCCACCCHAVRAIRDFNCPGMIAPPHFVPQLDAAKCTYCGRCAQRCPMGALVVDAVAKSHRRLTERCVGCGQCVLACNPRALGMQPSPDYRPPYRNWFSMIAHLAPKFLATSWQVYRQRSGS